MTNQFLLAIKSHCSSFPQLQCIRVVMQNKIYYQIKYDKNNLNVIKIFHHLKFLIYQPYY